MNNLIWKDIKGFEGYFKINSDLEVYRIDKNGVLIPKKTTSDNCYEFHIKDVGRRKYRANILFLEYFPEIYIERKIQELEKETNCKWKRVKDYENLYLISEKALLYKLDFNGFSTGSLKPNGYIRVTLMKNGEKKHLHLHRIMALTFLEKVDGKDFVNHKDGNKENNCIDNLEWVTKSENNIHKYRVLGHKQSNRIPIKVTDTLNGNIHLYDNVIKAEVDLIGKETTGFRYCLKNGTLYKNRYKIELQ